MILKTFPWPICIFLFRTNFEENYFVKTVIFDERFKEIDKIVSTYRSFYGFDKYSNFRKKKKNHDKHIGKYFQELAYI